MRVADGNEQEHGRGVEREGGATVHFLRMRVMLVTIMGPDAAPHPSLSCLAGLKFISHPALGFVSSKFAVSMHPGDKLFSSSPKLCFPFFVRFTLFSSLSFYCFPATTFVVLHEKEGCMPSHSRNISRTYFCGVLEHMVSLFLRL